MTQNNDSQYLEDRFAAAGQQLMEASAQRIREIMTRNGLTDVAIHTLVSTIVDGTVTARRIAERTRHTIAEAMASLQILKDRNLIDHATPGAPNEDTPWYLTAKGESEAKTTLRPMTEDVEAVLETLTVAVVHRAIEALEKATSGNVHTPQPSPDMEASAGCGQT